MLRFATILFFVLGVTWLVLSGFGFSKPVIVVLGTISLCLTLLIAFRMRILDQETAPYATVPQTLIYFSWLFKEIIKANVTVVRSVISPDLEVSPTLTKIPTKGKSDLARTMFANSITLTPGTVSIDLQDDYILVHALLSEMSEAEDFVEMSEKSGWAVGESRDA